MNISQRLLIELGPDEEYPEPLTRLLVGAPTTLNIDVTVGGLRGLRDILQGVRMDVKTLTNDIQSLVTGVSQADEKMGTVLEFISGLKATGGAATAADLDFLDGLVQGAREHLTSLQSKEDSVTATPLVETSSGTFTPEGSTLTGNGPSSSLPVFSDSTVVNSDTTPDVPDESGPSGVDLTSDSSSTVPTNIGTVPDPNDGSGVALTEATTGSAEPVESSTEPTSESGLVDSSGS